EIPAPASGVLQEIKVTEGTTVGVNTVVGTIAADGEAAAAPAKPAAAAPPSAEKPVAAKAEEKKTAPSPPPSATPARAAHEEEEEARSSPLVRKIAREHGVSLSQVSGTGLGGRITKQDILSFIESPSSAPAPYPGDLVPVTNMRKIIPQRMIESRRTSAHVHCMYEVDLTRIVNLRNKHKAGFEQRHGARLTFMPFFVRSA